MKNITSITAASPCRTRSNPHIKYCGPDLPAVDEGIKGEMAANIRLQDLKIDILKSALCEIIAMSCKQYQNMVGAEERRREVLKISQGAVRS